jgi:quercetin dioxygenase-like cupin family protein
MLMKKKALWGLLAVVAAAGVYAATVLATPQSGVTTSTVAQASFPEFNVTGKAHPANIWRTRLKAHGNSDLYVIDNVLSPGGTTGWHSHPGPSLIFVLKGQVTNYLGDDPSCTPHVYTAHQGFLDPGGDSVHMLRNEGTVDAETVAVQVLPAGATRKIDMADPQNCHF